MLVSYAFLIFNLFSKLLVKVHMRHARHGRYDPRHPTSVHGLACYGWSSFRDGVVRRKSSAHRPSNFEFV